MPNALCLTVRLARLGLVPLLLSAFALSAIAVEPEITEPEGVEPEITEPERVDEPTPDTVDRVVERLPEESQSILLACQEQGGVDLVAGAAPDGMVVCGDGASAPVEYDRYLATASDFVAAGVLVGFRSVMIADPRVSPDLLITLLATSEGANAIRGATETALAQSSLVTSASESASLLTDEVMRRLLPSFNSTNNLETLLGTEEQYESVVQNFCVSPGLTVEQTQQAIPGLVPIQLYAICIDASRTISVDGDGGSSGSDR
jgi:hypothetical protein